MEILPEDEKRIHDGFKCNEEGVDDPVHHPLDIPGWIRDHISFWLYDQISFWIHDKVNFWIHDKVSFWLFDQVNFCPTHSLTFLVLTALKL